MLQFEYIIELKEGYKPIMQNERETKVKFLIEAEDQATADRAVDALFKGSANVKDYCGCCID